ncbi:MAG: redoxin domain-containing protein [Gemmatimonadetes bacterium]|nr:redoxin domain-containing protein [Gemmatimonadota bacterium]
MEAYRDQYASLFRGGRDVVVLAVSTDGAEDQAAWARDADFPFLFAADPGAEVGQLYGAFRERSDGSFLDNRTLFVIDAEGKIAWRAVPFREVDPTAYEELGLAIDEISPGDPSGR